jgi:hypothetical protein
MTITPATPCYGKLCPELHRSCDRYARVDGKPCEVPAIGTCDHGDPEKSLFVPVEGAQ